MRKLLHRRRDHMREVPLPEFSAKNGEFRYMDFGICDNSRPFAQIRLKMTSKMFANGRFWTGDRFPDYLRFVKNEKNPSFDHALKSEPGV
jgi:hypothetical protein